MNADDLQFLKIGREVVRMIYEVRAVAAEDAGYARRTFTFPGGQVEMLLANNSKVADLMEEAVKTSFYIQSVTPGSLPPSRSQ